MEQGEKDQSGQAKPAKCGLGEKIGREACRVCFDAPHLIGQIVPVDKWAIKNTQVRANVIEADAFKHKKTT